MKMLAQWDTTLEPGETRLPEVLIPASVEYAVVSMETLGDVSCGGYSGGHRWCHLRGTTSMRMRATENRIHCRLHTEDSGVRVVVRVEV